MKIQKSRLKKFYIEDSEYLWDPDSCSFYGLSEDISLLDRYADTDDLLEKNPRQKELHHALINISNACNLNCKYCFSPNAEDNSKQLMNKNVARSIVNQLKKNDKIYILTFFGGEPTLNFEVMEYITEHLSGIVKRFSVISNGTNITPDLMKFFSDYNFNVSISLDGPEEVHNRLRGQYQLTDTNIKILAKNPNIKLRLSCQLTPIHLKSGFSGSSLHNFFHDSYPGIPFSIGTIVETCSDLNFSEKQIGELQELDKWEIEQTFSHLTKSSTDYVYSKAVTKIIYSIISKSKSHLFCEKCNQAYNRYYDIDGKTYPCHVFFGKAQYCLSHQKSSLIERVNNKLLYERCKDCWANNLCSRCPLSIVQQNNLKNFPPEICPKEQFIEMILSYIIRIRKDSVKYRKFCHNFAKLYNKLHIV